MIPIGGKFFKGKPVYKCTHCGMTVGLENPETKILCPTRAKLDNMHNLHTKRHYQKLLEDDPSELPHDEDLSMKPNMSVRDRIILITKRKLLSQAKQSKKLNPLNPNNELVMEEIEREAERAADAYLSGKAAEKADKLDKVKQQEQAKIKCSQEQIDERLAICNTCEYYENESCLQCGCAISRDRVYGNKLAYKNKSCPIGKWGPIFDQTPTNGEKGASSGDEDSGSGSDGV